MSAVDFPEELTLKRSSNIASDNSVVIDYAADGTPLARTTSTSKYTTIEALIELLYEAEKDSLVSFINTNAANDIAWTIDGVDYVGKFIGSYSMNKTGNLYNVSFRFYGRRT